MLKKVIGVLLALVGIVTSALLGVLLAAIFYWSSWIVLGFGSSNPPSIITWTLVFVIWGLALASPFGGLIIGVRWARALFTD